MRQNKKLKQRQCMSKLNLFILHFFTVTASKSLLPPNSIDHWTHSTKTTRDEKHPNSPEELWGEGPSSQRRKESICSKALYIIACFWPQRVRACWTLVSKEKPSTGFYELLGIRKFKEFSQRVILGNLYIEELEPVGAGYDGDMRWVTPVWPPTPSALGRLSRHSMLSIHSSGAGEACWSRTLDKGV